MQSSALLQIKRIPEAGETPALHFSVLRVSRSSRFNIQSTMNSFYKFPFI
jgi:hypothetical protein